MKRRLFLLKTEVHFTKNGGTFYQKRRYVLLKTYIRFYFKGYFFDLKRYIENFVCKIYSNKMEVMNSLS